MTSAGDQWIVNEFALFGLRPKWSPAFRLSCGLSLWSPWNTKPESEMTHRVVYDIVTMAALFYSPVDSPMHQTCIRVMQLWCIGEINRWIKQRSLYQQHRLRITTVVYTQNTQNARLACILKKKLLWYDIRGPPSVTADPFRTTAPSVGRIFMRYLSRLSVFAR